MTRLDCIKEEGGVLAKRSEFKGGFAVLAFTSPTMARRLASAKEPVVVVLLGGAHDLGEALARHALRVRYVCLTTHAYREASGGR